MADDDRSQGMTILLMAIAMVLTAAVAAFAVYLFMVNHEAAEPVATTTVTPPTASSTPTTETVTQQQAPEPVQVPTGSAVVQGGPCLDSELRTFGTDANGNSLVCASMGASGNSWVMHGANSGATHNVGEPCDTAVDSVAQDSSGRAIMCGGTTWVTGP